MNGTLKTSSATHERKKMGRNQTWRAVVQQQGVINFSYRVEYLSAAETWLTPSGPQHLFQIFRLEAVFAT